MSWFVHVNRGVIDANRKHGRNDPPLTLRRGKHGKSRPAFEVRLPPDSVMIYSPHEPILPCGARCVVECPTEPTVLR